MVFNSTEVDSSEGFDLDSYKESPSWIDQVLAASSLYTSANMATSEMNYYNEARIKNMQEWKTQDPDNIYIYDTIGNLDQEVYNRLEAMYDENRITDIKNWNSTGTGETYLKFKELSLRHGFKDLKEVQQEGRNKSLEDYKKAVETLSEGDSITAKFAGGLLGMAHDPLFWLTLPAGGFTSGSGVIVNALRSFGQEALIEASFQAASMPQVYSYKKELGIKTSIQEEAQNALTSVVAAGTLRASASVVLDSTLKTLGKGEWFKPNMDLTAKGLKVLKAKDPELAADYEKLQKGQTTESLDEHAMNKQAVEFGQEVTEIKNPNELGAELNKAEPVPEVSEDLIIQRGGRKAFQDLLSDLSEEKAMEVSDKVPEMLDIVEEATDEKSFREFLDAEMFFPAERVAELEKELGANWKDQVTVAALKQGYIEPDPLRGGSLDNLESLSASDIADDTVSFDYKGSQVKMTKNEDGTFSFDTTELHKGSGEGTAVYDKMFQFLFDRGLKYKADTRLSAENQQRLPLNLLAFRDKTGSDAFTVENIDSLVSNLISNLEKHTGESIDKITLDQARTYMNIGENNLQRLKDFNAADKQETFDFTTPYDDMQFVSGKDLDGNIETKSYKAVKEELDAEAEHLRSIEKCLL